MGPMKIDFKAKCNANKRGFRLKRPRFIVAMAIVLSFIYLQRLSAQKIRIETGFENHVQPEEESPFQPSTKIVKNGNQSLEIFSEVEHQLHISGHGLETNAFIVSLEFWVYAERGEQSFAVNMHAADRSFDNNAGGPYIEWYDGDIRYHVHQGDP